jgi:transposase
VTATAVATATFLVENSFLPPYSHDFNPIESAWALIKKRICSVAPCTGTALRRTAQRARSVVPPRHCHNWFAHAGYELK